MSRYILAVDQSTQGTKGLLFNEDGELVCRADRPHRQIISPLGWVSHDPEEIRRNTLAVCRDTVEKAGIDKGSIAAFGISNQRETTVAWDRETGQSICDAIVWQCARAEAVCERLSDRADKVRARTGLNLSPYFPAAKMGWIMENVPEAKKLADAGRLCLGTVDSWLLSFLTKEKVHATDYSNASRTQLFDIIALRWDEKLCRAFGVPVEALPEVRMSDSVFGTTDLDGYLDKPIPVCGVLGDSHGALFGQDCRRPGQVKATYGTGSSVMMNIGDEPRFSSGGLVTSLAWGMNGRVEYVFEGNLNYTGAVMTWLRRDVGLIENDAEATELARAADADVELASLRVDGGPTASEYLMQFQSDMARASVEVPNLQELSGMGAAYAAGISAGIYDPDRVYEHVRRRVYAPAMDAERREELYKGWQAAVRQVLMHD